MSYRNAHDDYDCNTPLPATIEFKTNLSELQQLCADVSELTAKLEVAIEKIKSFEPIVY